MFYYLISATAKSTPEHPFASEIPLPVKEGNLAWTAKRKIQEITRDEYEAAMQAQLPSFEQPEPVVSQAEQWVQEQRDLKQQMDELFYVGQDTPEVLAPLQQRYAELAQLLSQSDVV